VSDGTSNWATVNHPGASSSVEAKAFWVAQKPTRTVPIDKYYSYLHEIVLLSARDELEEFSPMPHLLLLGAVLATEQYFREVLCGTLRVCPLSRRHARSRVLSLGGLDYFGHDGVGFAILENSSLSTQGEIEKQTANLTGVRVKPNSPVAAAIAEFDKVCHLRHAAIHSRGEPCARNLSELGVIPEGRVQLHLTRLKLQSVVSVCHSLVRSFNSFLFEQLVKRLIVSELLVGDWARSRSIFEPVFELFYSHDDAERPDSAQERHAGIGALIQQIREGNVGD
jgi:hypothetical protein